MFNSITLQQDCLALIELANDTWWKAPCVKSLLQSFNYIKQYTIKNLINIIVSWKH